ncbi:MAG TPA: MerR family transcriptional regulator [Bdellovibrionota bacterium]|nr:MerR family transcriptional regulator [Bdellovibrionota bacterium]
MTADEGMSPFTAPDQVAEAVDAFSSATQGKTAATAIPDRLYFRIGDVADLVGVKPYVLRYWETEFPMIAPQKSASGQRVYRRSDVETVLMIKHLLYTERYSIDGARKRLRELRKDGVLKAFKQETVAKNAGAAPETPKAGMSREAARAIIAIARELKAMADMPFSQLLAD